MAPPKWIYVAAMPLTIMALVMLRGSRESAADLPMIQSDAAELRASMVQITARLSAMQQRLQTQRLEPQPQQRQTEQSRSQSDLSARE